jgi:hypothetical protein
LRSGGLSPSSFCASCTLSVIIRRFTVTGVLAKPSPVMTAIALAGMCPSLAGFAGFPEAQLAAQESNQS